MTPGPASALHKDDRRVKVALLLHPETIARVDTQADRLLVSRNLAFEMVVDFGIDDLEAIPSALRPPP